MKQDELVYLGKITRHQGKKGGVRVFPYSSSLLDGEFKELILVADGIEKGKLVVEYVHRMKKVVVVKFYSIDDIDKAKSLAGCEIAVRRMQLKHLAPDEFYWCDLVGLDVFSIGGDNLGKVEDVFETGSNEVFVVKGNDKEILVPAIIHVVKLIDIDNGRMIVDIDGFI